MKLQVFDPAMCCPTGVCGPGVDPALPKFAADLDWLKGQGIEVERYNLSQQPAAFAQSAVVRQAMAERGTGCLPLILVDGHEVSGGSYPDRTRLASHVGLLVADEAPAAPRSGCTPKPAGASEKCC